MNTSKLQKWAIIAREYIENQHSATPTIVIGEISKKLQKEIALGNETQEGHQTRLEFMRATTRIVDLDFETAAEAGKMNEDLKGKG